jgi:DNA-binding MurR/RpiR family transcriptional regulator
MMDVIDQALNQMDNESLQRIVDHINAGKPICLDGPIFDDDGHG